MNQETTRKLSYEISTALESIHAELTLPLDRLSDDEFKWLLDTRDQLSLSLLRLATVCIENKEASQCS